jgi:hypothetical protein
MAYYIAHGFCIACRRLFSFNPHLVPSSSAVTGSREPICQSCVDRINPIREANGLRPIKVIAGAYEIADEAEWPLHDYD